ncbi:MAG TPA: hypothetical protein VN829_09360 [Dongiaceae bacterium]|nr:hypothetical protein [Dongiaceae bacterium]
MSILQFVVVISLLGGLAWLVNRFVTGVFKTIINVGLIIVAVWITLDAFGILDLLKHRLPNLG